MNSETLNDCKIVCGQFYPKEDLAVGQRWARANCASRIVTIRELEHTDNGALWVKFGVHGQDRTYEKDWFTFQTQYCKVIEK